MGIAIVFLVFLPALATMTVIALRAEATLKAAYTEGRRAGLKRAAEIARERGNIAIQIAPEGDLGAGCLRGQMAHAVELEILNEMVQR